MSENHGCIEKELKQFGECVGFVFVDDFFFNNLYILYKKESRNKLVRKKVETSSVLITDKLTVKLITRAKILR